MLAECIGEPQIRTWVEIAPHAGRLRARLFDVGVVHTEYATADGAMCMEVELRRSDFNALCKNEGLQRAVTHGALQPDNVDGGDLPQSDAPEIGVTAQSDEILASTPDPARESDTLENVQPSEPELQQSEQPETDKEEADPSAVDPIARSPVALAQ